MSYKDRADKPVELQGTIPTYTGRWVSFKTLTPEDVDIRDIAHSLAATCRFRGASAKFYSVAEHCVNCYLLAQTRNRPIPHGNGRPFPDDFMLAVLLHDAAETYMCDLPAPYKRTEEFKAFKGAENSVSETIYEAFGVEVTRRCEQLIHDVDYEMLLKEFAGLFPPHMWPYPNIERMLNPFMNYEPGLSPAEAEELFLDCFAKHREVPNEQYDTTA